MTEQDGSFTIPCPNCMKEARKRDRKLEVLWEERSGQGAIRRFLDYLKEEPDLIEQYGSSLSTENYETLSVDTTVEYCDEGESRDIEVKVRINCSACDASFRCDGSGTIEA